MGFQLSGPGSVDITPGTSAWANITVKKSKGRSRRVNLSLRLETELFAVLSTSTGMPTYQSVLTVTAAATLPEGEYPINITGTDGREVNNMLIVARNRVQPTPPVAGPAAPVLSTLSPTNHNEDAGAFTLTVNGSGFLSGATVFWNGASRSTTFVGSTQVTAAILAGDITTPGTASVTAINPGSSASNALTFTINSLVPVLSTLSPSSITEDTGAFTLTVNGSGFVSGATVFWNGSSRSTTFVNSGQVTAAILAGDITTPGSASVTATNPSTAASNALTFTTFSAGGFTADVWVAKAADGGSNSNNGLAEFDTGTAGPKLTIAAGLAILSSGQKMAIKQGTYTENINNSVPSGGGSFGSATQIVAYPGHTVTVNGGSGEVLVLGSQSYIIFDRLIFDGVNQGSGTNCVEMNGTAHHIRFTDCEFTHGGGSAGERMGFLCHPRGCDSHELIRCVSHNNGGTDTQSHGYYIGSDNNLLDGCEGYSNPQDGGQIYVAGDNPTGNTIRNCYFHDNGIGSTIYGVGFHFWGNGNLMYNCVVTGNMKPGVYINGTSNQLYNCTIYGNGEEGVRIAGSGHTVRNCIAYGNGSGIDAGGTQSNNFTSDPSFANAAGNDFHLTAGSSSTVRNGGADLSGTFTTDKEGTARPSGSWSIGAYEQA